MLKNTFINTNINIFNGFTGENIKNMYFILKLNNMNAVILYSNGLIELKKMLLM